MTKMIEIDDNGHVWNVPLQFIADHRAKYYAERDDDTTHQEEVDFVIDDDYEGIDWMQNNMNFEDYAGVAVKVQTPTVTKPSSDAETSIIEV